MKLKYKINDTVEAKIILGNFVYVVTGQIIIIYERYNKMTYGINILTPFKFGHSLSGDILINTLYNVIDYISKFWLLNNCFIISEREIKKVLNITDQNNEEIIYL